MKGRTSKGELQQESRVSVSNGQPVNNPIHKLRKILIYIVPCIHIGHLFLSSILIFSVAYILGRWLLVGNIGNEGPLHISYASWISDYFPRIPNWYPLQGTGISLQRAYPLLSHIIIALISKLSGLSILESFHLVGFSAIVITAINLYILCWGLWRNKTVGLIAAIFYLVAPLSWWYVFEHGWITVVVASTTFPIILLCFIRYFSYVLKGERYFQRVLWFLGLILSLAFSTLSHLFVGSAAALMLILYVVFYGIFSQKGQRWRTLLAGVKGALLCGVTLILLLAFWLVPIAYYGTIAEQHGSIVLDVASRYMYLDELIGISPLDTVRFTQNASFPIAVVILSLAGALLAIFYSHKAIALASSCFLVLLTVQATEIRTWLTSVLSILNYLVSYRSVLILLTFLIPIVGAYGAWALARTIVNPLSIFRHLKRPKKYKGEETTKTYKYAFVVVILTLIISFGVLYIFRNISSRGPEYINYGLMRKGLYTRDLWSGYEISENDAGNLAEQLAPVNWPPFELADKDQSIDYAINYASYLPDKEFLRINVSPYLGGLAQNLATYSGASQFNSYQVTANLNLDFAAYMADIFFIDSPPENEGGTSKTLNAGNKWCGSEFVFLNPKFDDVDIYATGGWNLILKEENLEIWRDTDAPNFASLSRHPTVLVISKLDINAYESVFRAANLGAIPYEEAWIIQGEDHIDYYSLDDLRLFDALFLHGYTYENFEHSWNLLEEYVLQGGSLFVDTGWQWTVPEWETDNVPAVLPISRLSWTDYGVTNDYLLEDLEVSGDVDPEKLSALDWDGLPWSVSAAKKEEVRDWGRVVMSVTGQPLIVAGELGQGRVIWSGMNLVSHALDKGNQEEINLLHNLVDWLLKNQDVQDNPVLIKRDHPDRVVFNMELPTGDTYWLLWRESVYPAWHAYQQNQDGRQQELPIFRSGPGFMLIPIEGGSEKTLVELVWETPLIEKIATLISIVTAVGLIAGVVSPTLWPSILSRLLRRLKSKPSQGSVEWLSERTMGSSAHPDRTSHSDQVEELQHIASGDEELEKGNPLVVGDELSGDVDVEAIWLDLIESGRISSAQNEQANWLIEKWKRSRASGSQPKE